MVLPLLGLKEPHVLLREAHRPVVLTGGLLRIRLLCQACQPLGIEFGWLHWDPTPISAHLSPHQLSVFFPRPTGSHMFSHVLPCNGSLIKVSGSRSATHIAGNAMAQLICIHSYNASKQKLCCTTAYYAAKISFSGERTDLQVGQRMVKRPWL